MDKSCPGYSPKIYLWLKPTEQLTILQYADLLAYTIHTTILTDTNGGGVKTWFICVTLAVLELL